MDPQRAAAASAELVDAVFAEVQTFAAGAQQSDDITVLAIGRVAGSEPSAEPSTEHRSLLYGGFSGGR